MLFEIYHTIKYSYAVTDMNHSSDLKLSLRHYNIIQVCKLTGMSNMSQVSMTDLSIFLLISESHFQNNEIFLE